GAAISHIRVSPYNVANRTVFLGTGNSQVAKMAADKTITMITPPTLVGSVSCIEVGASDDELLVTASNYGVVSVFYTNDGGATWTEKEGDLPDMPVRWALFNPLNRNEVLLATEVGVWKTLNISASTPAWEKANTGMGNVRVDMLQYRALDNTIVAATHGRGLFTSTNFTLDVKENVLVKNTNIKIFPTVSNGLITVASRVNAQNAKFTAYDLSGKQVFSKSLNLVNGGEQPINLNVKRGIYLISIKTDTFSSSYKIIIK
ncbi:MAG: T9SS type A sorting domain-containing protein, partial [Zetaproteobacteria bacterium]|nr:T9SS type A sorting domain-containing protein [Flavobacteriales bacterium]